MQALFQLLKYAQYFPIISQIVPRLAAAMAQIEAGGEVDLPAIPVSYKGVKYEIDSKVRLAP